MIYNKYKFILTHGSGGWEVQEHGAGISLASGEALLLHHNMVGKPKVKQEHWKEAKCKGWPRSAATGSCN